MKGGKYLMKVDVTFKPLLADRTRWMIRRLFEVIFEIINRYIPTTDCRSALVNHVFADGRRGAHQESTDHGDDRHRPVAHGRIPSPCPVSSHVDNRDEQQAESATYVSVRADAPFSCTSMAQAGGSTHLSNTVLLAQLS